jgi:serine/threonine protein kinase
MAPTWTCECGHRWHAAVNGGACPACGSAGVQLLGEESDTAQLAGDSAVDNDSTLARPSGPPPAPWRPPIPAPPEPPPPAPGEPSLAATLDRTMPPAALPPSRGPVPDLTPTYNDPHATLAPPVPGGVTKQAPPGDPHATRFNETLSRPSGPVRLERPKDPIEEAGTVPGYHILGILGRGGMGVVYKAEHQRLHRTVALKMVLAGAHAGKDELARFQIEAEAVARLQHPNIVQIYEIGEHHGLPFFSLEFVAGGSLQQRLDGTPLPERTAADLVIQLARAMDYAHRQGIVHRDLKPANILLATADAENSEKNTKDKIHAAETGLRPATPLSGLPASSVSSSLPSAARLFPKITDFGLAKRLESDSGQTGTGNILGTPSYMAPEQAQGHNRQVGPPADIYALGSILYDLLTGRPPFKGATILDTLQQVRADEPVPPTRLRPKVPRDLEIICLKCLEKEPHKRYASAGALADDLERFVAGRPIEARATPTWERAAKWARRRPAVAALLAALAATLAASFCALLALWLNAENARAAAVLARDETAIERNKAMSERDQKEQARAAAAAAQTEAEKQRDRAERNLKRAFEAGDVLFTQVGRGRLLKEPRMENVRRDILLKALAYYKGFKDIEGDTPEVKWQTARAYRQVGYIYEQLGKYREARAAFEVALPLLEDLSHGDGSNRDYAVSLAGARSQYGVVLQALKQYPPAQSEYQKAIDRLEPLVKAQPSEPAAARELAIACNNLALLQQERLNPPAAGDLFVRSIGLWRQLRSQGDAGRDYQAELARVLTNYGVWLQITGSADAGQAYQEAYDLLSDLTAWDPDMPGYQLERGLVLINLGAWREATSPAAAEQAYRDAAALFDKLSGDFPNVPDMRRGLALSRTNLSVLLAANKKRAAEAAQERAKALEDWKKLAAGWPQNGDYHLGVVKCVASEALYQWDKGNKDDAAALIESNLGHLRELTAVLKEPELWVALARTHSNRGQMYGGVRKVDDEEAQYRAGIKVLDEARQKFADMPAGWHEVMADLQANLAFVFVAERKDAAAALPYMKEAMAHQREAMKENPAGTRKLVGYGLQLAALQLECKDYVGASATATELEPVLTATKGLKGVELVQLARIVARGLPKVAADQKKATEDQVLRLLQGAVRQGFRDVQVLRDPIFGAVRERQEYAELLAPLEKK